MRQGLIDDISKVADSELIECIKVNGLFSSTHEGYAVILEEVEETKAEFEEIESHMQRVWSLIKSNLNNPSLEMIKNIGDHAKLLACEAIQVAAMCEKFQQSAKNWRG